MIAPRRSPKPASDMLLMTYKQRYLAARDVTTNYAADLRNTILYFERWLGRQPLLSDLTPEKVNEWLTKIGETMKPRTVQHHRRSLVALWNGAYHEDLISDGPRRVRKIKVPHVPPRAWTLEEVMQLIEAAKAAPGTFRCRRGVRRSHFALAYVLVAWDSGLRPSDLIILRFDEIAADGTCVHVISKTGRVHTCYLQPETLAAVDRLRPHGQPMIFGDLVTQDCVCRLFRMVAKSAGLIGSPKKLRKSAATAVECIQPGAASILLGHRSPEMARLHYIDPRIAKPSLVSPPRLEIAPLLLEEQNEGESLRTAIARSGVTLEAFAERIGINPKYLGQVLAGKMPMSAKMRARINAALAEGGPQS